MGTSGRRTSEKVEWRPRVSACEELLRETSARCDGAYHHDGKVRSELVLPVSMLSFHHRRLQMTLDALSECGL